MDRAEWLQDVEAGIGAATRRVVRHSFRFASDMARDVAQDAWVRALEAGPGAVRVSTRNWSHGLMWNVWRERVAKDANRRRLLREVAPVMPRVLPPAVEDVVLCRQLLALLTTEQRVAVGLSETEAAMQLGTSYERACRLIDRAYTTMRCAIAEAA